MRGAAESLGIVTHFYSKTEKAPSTVINWGWSIPDMYQNKAKFVEAFTHIQNFALNKSIIDRKISFGIYLDGQVFNIGGMYFGDAKYFNDTIIHELLRGLPADTRPNPGAQEIDWIQSMTILDGEPQLAQPIEREKYTKHSNFFAKSSTVPESSPFTEQFFDIYFTYIQEHGVNPKNDWFSIINLYGGPDSQINVKDTNFAAYKERDSLWVVSSLQCHAIHASTNSFAVSALWKQ
jgi:hypothetical protein